MAAIAPLNTYCIVSQNFASIINPRLLEKVDHRSYLNNSEDVGNTVTVRRLAYRGPPPFGCVWLYLELNVSQEEGRKLLPPFCMKKEVGPVDATDRKFLALDYGGRIKRFTHKLAGPRQDVSCDTGSDMWPTICSWCCVEPLPAPPDQAPPEETRRNSFL